MDALFNILFSNCIFYKQIQVVLHIWAGACLEAERRFHTFDKAHIIFCDAAEFS